MKLLTKLLFFSLFATIIGCNQPKQQSNKNLQFVSIDGQNLVDTNGKPFFIRGINLGNWLNPEGYMFRFQKVSSTRLIDQAFREMVGPTFTDQFWKSFKDNYITREDIKYIKKLGMNTIRLPFHYKLFTNEDYLGLTAQQDGFQRIDTLLSWCKESSIFLILDMHDAPGGQTGDNIDDSYGYPWLMTDSLCQQKFVTIWQSIAERYKNETQILGYDLLNEPIAHHFKDELPKLNAALEPVYMKAVAAIRKVDKNHIVLLGGAQWNSNFKVFTDSKFDSKLMYTCHRYWCDTLQANIQDFVSFRDSVNLPMLMGETGENNNDWIAAWTRLMERNNISWTYWTFKRMGSETIMQVAEPENWNIITAFAESARDGFDKIRTARPNQEIAKKAMLDYLENIKLKNCSENSDYIKAIGLSK